MKFPTLVEAIGQLEEVAGIENFDPDKSLPESDADSLDLTEWFYALQEDHPGIPVDDSILEDVSGGVTFRTIYSRIVSTVAISADDS